MVCRWLPGVRGGESAPGQDESVEFVGLIDTYSCHDVVKSRRLSGYGQEQKLELLQRLVDVRTGVAVQFDGLDFMAAVDDCRSRGWLPPGVTVAEVEQFVSLCLTLTMPRSATGPPSLPIPVHLFAAERQPESDVSNGWQSVLGSNLRIEVIGGDHQSLMREDVHLGKLAATMCRCLAEVESDPMPPAEPHRAALIIRTGHGEATRVFCVPGAGANVTSLLPLAEDLSPSCKVIGFQARGHTAGTIPHTCVEAAARAYLHELREIAPHGPYHLLGHSFGGWIAFEMARQLALVGESVAPLVLVDSEAPGVGRRLDRLETLIRFIDLVEMENGCKLRLGSEETEVLGRALATGMSAAPVGRCRRLTPKNLVRDAAQRRSGFRVPYQYPLHPWEQI